MLFPEPSTAPYKCAAVTQIDKFESYLENLISYAPMTVVM